MLLHVTMMMICARTVVQYCGPLCTSRPRWPLLLRAPAARLRTADAESPGVVEHRNANLQHFKDVTGE